jgi:hypothetical protein
MKSLKLVSKLKDQGKKTYQVRIDRVEDGTLGTEPDEGVLNYEWRWHSKSTLCSRRRKSKSKGIRVIYYWVNEDDQIFFLVAYPKSVKDNLTDKETAILRQLVKEQFHG